MKNNVLLLAGEILALGSLTLVLHGRSPRYGLAPLLIFLSGLVAVLHSLGTIPVFVDIAGRSFEVSNMTLVPVIMMAVLVLYISDGTAVARVTILGIAGLSVLVLAIQAGRQGHLTLPGGSEVLGLPADSPVYSRTASMTLASLLAFLSGLTVLSVVFQFFANRPGWLPRLALPSLALAVGLTVDDLVFRAVLRGPGELLAGFPGAIPGKLLALVLLGPMVTVYLTRWVPAFSGARGARDRPALDVIFGSYRRREVDLQTAQSRLGALVSGAPLVVFELDENGIITLSEGAGLERLGLRPGQAVGSSAMDLYPEAAEDIRLALRGHRVRSSFARDDVAFEVQYAPVVRNGGVVGVTGVATDITPRIAAERENRENQVRFRSTFEHAAVGLLHADLDGRILMANRAVCGLLEMAEQDIAHRSFVELHQDADRPVVERTMKALVAGGDSGEPCETRLLNAEGDPVWVFETISLVRDDQGSPRFFLIVEEDLTQRRITEQQLRQAQKMETVGQLTGGVAHDFNNLLTVIMAGLEMAMDEAREGGRSHEALVDAFKAAERGASLVNRLLAFSRRQPLHPVAVDPVALIEGMEELIQRSLGDAILIRIKAELNVGFCLADTALLESAILNLAINARDAMPDGGLLTFRIEQVDVRPDDQQEVGGHAAEGQDVHPGLYVRITVSDQGHGIAPDVLPRVFEPFFTTKPVGKGSGLGLSMVYGFTQQSDGFVRVESQPGLGTSVHLHFPATANVFH